jgi:fatty acid desaturase
MKQWWEKRKRRKNLRKLVEEYKKENVPSMAQEMFVGLLEVLLIIAIGIGMFLLAFFLLIIVLGYIYEI